MKDFPSGKVTMGSKVEIIFVGIVLRHMRKASLLHATRGVPQSMDGGQ